MGLTECDEPGHRVDLLELSFSQIPVDPRDRIILAVGVVIAVLGTTKFVAAREHRRARGNEHRREDVALRARTQIRDRHVGQDRVGRHRVGVSGVDGQCALDAVVPRAVIVRTVAVVLQVRGVVLAVVSRQVRQREAIVCRHEVDRGAWAAQATQPVLKHVLGARQTRCEVVGTRHDMARGLGAHVRQPEVTQGAAVVVVPLGEGDREVARLPAAGAHVPGLGDELDVCEQIVRGHRDEERVHRAETGRETAQRGRQVEAEAVHAHLADPVAQRIQHHLNGLRVIHVHGVAGARHVDCLDGARGRVAVVHVGIEAAPRQ